MWLAGGPLGNFARIERADYQDATLSGPGSSGGSIGRGRDSLDSMNSMIPQASGHPVLVGYPTDIACAPAMVAFRNPIFHNARLPP